ncbi:MAG: DNA-binding response regulator [Candidatus Wallbacteria bacterium HGW-Wallbacteria-1]|jgi:DNA-binding NtrC family response regulator|uniref:DNA-binding response regulator n=1 Tax=Candidatus Wallbacteria bacterium HGW-Wallbacteria-1 TaxID=2013854 RepID=A0A2N1PLI6_9BACT|nr:MAG: DNA-binding response regulator [Candidatus Wallbacteria bacterium HGW-Wallbacteria-1]
MVEKKENTQLKSLVIVEDEDLLGRSLHEALSTDFEVELFRCAEDALERIKDHSFDLALLDIRLPGMDGVEALSRIKEISPATLVVMMTAFGTMETVVEAVKKGAFTFVKKPFRINEIRHALQLAMKEMLSISEREYLKRSSDQRRGFGEMVGEHQVMVELFDKLRRVAEVSSTTVLIHGESGTGKELVAKAIHRMSPRSEGPFVEINCAALTPELLESELFGHEKGAFTDARQGKQGLFEIASGGSLFLDEVGELPLGLQAKLLKAIEEKKIRRVGGTGLIGVDVRVLAATNRDLAEMVSQGTFREDLLYRINVFPVIVPPLRQRPGDSTLIARYFIDHFNRELGRNVKGLTNDAQEAVKAYQWPGNVRELRNCVERAMILSTGDYLGLEDLGLGSGVPARHGEVTGDVLAVMANVSEEDINFPEEGIDFEGLIGNLEKTLISRALSQTRYNQTKSAKLLGLTREILRYRIKKYELE